MFIFAKLAQFNQPKLIWKKGTFFNKQKQNDIEQKNKIKKKWN